MVSGRIRVKIEPARKFRPPDPAGSFDAVFWRTGTSVAEDFSKKIFEI